MDDEYRLSGSSVVWAAFDGNDREILLYDGTTVTQLTHNDYYDFAPQVFGSTVVWEADLDGNLSSTADREIFLHDGTTTTQLTNNQEADLYPVVSDGCVAWSGGGSVLLYDGTTTTVLSDNLMINDGPVLSGSAVVCP